MEFARKVWKLLVAIKDGLVLLLLLMFFAVIYAALSIRPGPAAVREGALLLDLNGVVVEEPSILDPFSALLSREAPVGEFRARDVVRALRAAAKDDRINSVVLDLSGFIGGGFVQLQEIGEALDEVRKADKKVLTFGLAYIDDGMLLAAHADEVWVDPHGGAFITGPGGNRIYFARLLDKLKVKVEVFRVGTFKSAVEPYMLSGPSEASQRAEEGLKGAIWEQWKADYAAARPKAKLELVTTDPVAWLKASGGDTARAARDAGLVDRIGTKSDFDLRVAQIAGKDKLDDSLGAFAHTELGPWISANPEPSKGKAIGVVTIAGEIVDGDAGPGIAGGGRITGVLEDALDKDLAALVIRVDSPGGSLMASEHIRRAILRFKAKGIPIVASMGDVAASGGYWVSTPASRIFAEPATTTGSIGVFAVLPTFDKALEDLGVTGGGVKTTPLSGQPDVITGLAPEVGQMMQATVDYNYGEFLGLVEKSRSKSPKVTRVNATDWAEGRPWDGGTARQLGLVDQFGGLDDALAYAAKLAGLKDGQWHAEFLGGGHADPLSAALGMLGEGRRSSLLAGDFAAIAAVRREIQISGVRRTLDRVMGARGVQAYCLECPAGYAGFALPADDRGTAGFLARLLALTAG